MSRILLRGGHVYGPAAGAPSALALEDGRVAGVGDEAMARQYSRADEVFDVPGALVAPAFVDAHVHTVPTGFQETGLDLRDARSREEVLDRVAAASRAGSGDTVLLGSGWDETQWPDPTPPTAAEIERAAPGRRVVLDRVDCHSSVLSHALTAAVPGLTDIDGFEPNGRVEREALHAVTTTLATLIGPGQRLEAARAAVALYAAHGVAAFHENAAPHIGPEYELEIVAQASRERGLLATHYWGERVGVQTAARLGVRGLAGDLNADGAVGSHTAALRSAYADAAGFHGHAYLDEHQVAEHVLACTAAGLQAGFHCIGDAAIDAVAAGLRRAAERVGMAAVRKARHRVEHVEMASDEALDTLAELGVVASVQPMFDALWGGPDGMYAERLGDRWSGLNRFATMSRAGVRLAFGSDCPVTPPSPWEAVRAAVAHHDPGQRLDPTTAFAAHTRGGWGALPESDPQAGTLAPGAPAHVAVWECPAGLGEDGLPPLLEGADLPRLLLLVVGGRVVLRGADPVSDTVP